MPTSPAPLNRQTIGALLHTLALATLATGLTLSLTACGDDTAAGGGNVTENRTQGPPGSTNVPVGSKLVHVRESSCDPEQPVCFDDIKYDRTRLLKVKFVGAQGEPIPNAQIKFEVLENSAPGAKLKSLSADTGSDGIASNELKAASEPGSVRVRAATANGSSSVEFVITIGPKGESIYKVDFIEVGDANPKKLDVLLYAKDTSCASIRNNAPTAEKSDSNSEVDGAGTYPTVVFPNIKTGESFTIVAKAYMRENDKVEVAFGCVESSDATLLSNDKPVSVTVPMVKHLPNLVGDYEVIHTFDLVGALPPTIQTVINLLDTLTNDPGAFVIGCKGSKCTVETGGLIGLLLGALPDESKVEESKRSTLGKLRQTIAGFLGNSFIQDLARATIGEFIQNFIDNNAPPWVSKGIKISGDITKSLRQFRVNARFSVLEQPAYDIDSNTGLPVVNDDGTLTAYWTDKPNKHVWNGITLYWRQGCGPNDPATCGEAVTVEPQRAASNDEEVVEGTWGGSVNDLGVVTIGEHGLSLNYGNLVLLLIEQVALPRIFGDPTINSIDALIEKLISCEGLAERVNETFRNTEGIVRNLCTQLQTTASNALRKYMSTLTVGGSDQFLIGTPADKACQLFSPEPSVYAGDWSSAPYPYFERFGETAPKTKQCNWDVKVQFSSGAGAEPVNIQGVFQGKLK